MNTLQIIKCIEEKSYCMFTQNGLIYCDNNQFCLDANILRWAGRGKRKSYNITQPLSLEDMKNRVSYYVSNCNVIIDKKKKEIIVE